MLSAQNPLPPPGAPPAKPPPGTPNVGPLSADGRTAYITVRFAVQPSTLDPDYLNGVDAAAAAAFRGCGGGVRRAAG